MCTQRHLAHTACSHTYTTTTHTSDCPFYTTSSIEIQLAPLSILPTSSTSNPFGTSFSRYRLSAIIPLLDKQHSLRHVPELLEQGGNFAIVDGRDKRIEVKVLKAIVKEGECWACEDENRSKNEEKRRHQNETEEERRANSSWYNEIDI